jgi:hypothetical protein
MTSIDQVAAETVDKRRLAHSRRARHSDPGGISRCLHQRLEDPDRPGAVFLARRLNQGDGMAERLAVAGPDPLEQRGRFFRTLRLGTILRTLRHSVSLRRTRIDMLINLINIWVTLPGLEAF